MNRAIEQTLLSLLPAQNDDLPPQLVSLASSLLGQSRHRASTLKAEEEIARTYACAHIACDRLKITLNLPQIQPRPPIAPRIYKRLYNHLDTILPNTTSGPGGHGTPRSAARARAAATGGTPGPHPLTPSRGAGRFRDALGASPVSTRVAGQTRPTPSKEQALAPFRSAGASKPRPGASAAAGQQQQRQHLGQRQHHGHPAWLKGAVFHVCARLGQSRLAPFVLAGLDAVAALGGVGEDGAWAAENPLALLAALVFYAMRAAAKVEDDAAEARGDDRGGAAAAAGGSGELDEETYRALEKSLLKAVAAAREEMAKTRGKQKPAAAEMPSQEAQAGADDGYWEGWRDLKSNDLKGALVRVTDSGWLDSDWFRGIQDLRFESKESGGDYEHDDEHDGSTVGQVRRADTMLQERYDLVSEKRRREYAGWKADVLCRLDELERKGGTVPMDID